LKAVPCYSGQWRAHNIVMACILCVCGWYCWNLLVSFYSWVRGARQRVCIHSLLSIDRRVYSRHTSTCEPMEDVEAPWIVLIHRVLHLFSPSLHRWVAFMAATSPA
jgi:hypothetical protein